jgi:hypothetical protein
VDSDYSALFALHFHPGILEVVGKVLKLALEVLREVEPLLLRSGLLSFGSLLLDSSGVWSE